MQGTGASLLESGRLCKMLVPLVLGLCLFAGTAATAQKPTNEDCLACHSDSTLSKEVNGKRVSLYVNPDKFKDSMHGGMFTCVDCHTDLKTSPHGATPAKVSCATCHADEQAAYEGSFHAKAIKAGDCQAATCIDCHGSPHELLPASDPKSRVNHAHIWRRAIRSRPFSSSTCPPPAPNATPPSSRSSCGASTGRRSPAE